MRERKYEDGRHGYVSLPFEDIPDNYEMPSILTDGFCDYTYAGIFKALHDKYKNEKLTDFDLGVEFQNKEWCVQEMLDNQAASYLESAKALLSLVLPERDGNTVSYYSLPCAFCCRHAIELKIKQCLTKMKITSREINSHDIQKLWELLDKSKVPNSENINRFIGEVDVVDQNSIALRYGLTKNFDFTEENYQFDVCQLVINTMYLFNVLEEFIIR